MTVLAALPPSTMSRGLLIEGYASLFGVPDRSGDVVRAGAFTASLRTRPVAMQLQHKPSAEIGRWVRLSEDGRGLFVHAYWGRAVCETRLVSWWSRRRAGAFQFPGLVLTADARSCDRG